MYEQKRGEAEKPNPFTFPLEAATGFEPVNNGFADRRLTTWLRRPWSGKRDLNPRLQPWQGCTLPLSYSRSIHKGARTQERPLVILTPFPNKISSRQRPTLPPLKRQYHRRWRTLLPYSEWKRVLPLRHGHREHLSITSKNKPRSINHIGTRGTALIRKIRSSRSTD
jgi:hypothetical protein